MYPEVYEASAAAADEDEKERLTIKNTSTEETRNVLSKLEMLNGLAAQGSQGMKLKSLCRERLLFLASTKRVLIKMTSADEAEGCEAGTLIWPTKSTEDVERAFADEEDAIISEYKSKSNNFVPTISWTGRKGISQVILTWKMFASIVFSVLTGYELCGWWFAIYAAAFLPFSVAVGLFSVERTPKIHRFCTIVTLFGFYMGQVMVTIDIWQDESVFVHITVVSWLLGTWLSMMLFFAGINNALEWIFIYLLESYTFGIAMSRNPLNPHTP